MAPCHLRWQCWLPYFLLSLLLFIASARDPIDAECTALPDASSSSSQILHGSYSQDVLNSSVLVKPATQSCAAVFSIPIARYAHLAWICTPLHTNESTQWLMCTPSPDAISEVILGGDPCQYWAPRGEICPPLYATTTTTTLPILGSKRGEMTTSTRITTTTSTTTKATVTTTTTKPTTTTTTMTTTTQDEVLTHVGVANGKVDGNYWIKTSANSAKLLRVVHHGGKAWAMVLRKISTDRRFFSTNSFNDGGSHDQPSTNSAFKLSDAELHFMTSAHLGCALVMKCPKLRSQTWGMILVPNYDPGHLKGNLLRRNQYDRAYPIGGSTGSNQGDMARSSLDASDYPTEWDVELDSNNHCGGTQVWANWRSSQAYKFRYTSAGGCSYFHEDVNGAPGGKGEGVYGGSIYGFVGGGA